jgi:rhodanese-related sulfurtransferase
MFILGLASFSMLALADAPTAKIAPDQLAERIEKQDPNLVILDVRTPEEFAAGHVPGARNIPHDQLPNRIAEITGSKDEDVVVYCRTGRRAAIAEETLSSNGFKRLLHLDGDIIKWQEEKRALEK